MTKKTNKKAQKTNAVAITYNRKLKKMQYDNVSILTAYVRPEIMQAIMEALPSRVVKTKKYQVAIVMPTSGKKKEYIVSVI